MNEPRIRPEQYDAFRRQKAADFETRVVEHLRRKLADPTAGQSDDQIRQRVRDCVPRAAAYGFTTERQIVAFVDATYYLGETFDTDPLHAEITAVMKDETIPLDSRAGLVLGMACGKYHGSRSGGGAT